MIQIDTFFGMYYSNRVVQNMRDLDRVKDAYEDVQIPYAVLG